MIADPIKFTRRNILAAGAVFPALLALPAKFMPVDRRPDEVAFADMHAHLFNAHDLPVGRFLVEVLFRERRLPRLLKAVIDVIVRRIQPLAISARQEKARLEGTVPAGDEQAEWTPERFGAELGAWVRNPAGGEPKPDLFADPVEMRAAYDELVAAVVADAEANAPDPAVGTEQGSSAVDRAFARLAQKAESPPPADRDGTSAAPDPSTRDAGALECGTEECPDRPYSMSVPAILRYLGWGHLMLKSREHHLRHLVRLSRAHGEHLQLALNHLVDFDEWLGDRRLNGSSHSDQVDVADALAKVFAVPHAGRPVVDLRTFAGFCPLKHALEVRRFGRPGSFEAQLAQVDQGKIAGFKLYPPMGFRPWCNSALQNRDFDPRSRYRARHFREWSAVFGSAPTGNEIGIALDASLASFFAACAARDIPLMAHAGPGNAAGPDFGQRANPRHWYPVAERYRVRLSLGHLVNSAEDFVCALRAGRAPDCVWALGASRLLLDPAHSLQAVVYGDLGFLPELIEKPDLAAEFFFWLKRVYGARDPKLTRILYGSDYLMIGIMPDYDRHLSAIRAGMERASYNDETIDNILFSNARRFLTKMS